jgi:hypothetical protein
MRPTKKIEKSIKRLQDHTSEQLDNRTIGDACEAMQEQQQTQSAPGKPNIWGIVMRNRTIRIATAAAVIIGVLLGIQHFSGSVDGTGTAFAQMAEAMKQMRWMHVVAEITWPEEDKYRKNCRSESWRSFELDIYVDTSSTGEISFTDYNKKEVRVYDPKKNQITVSYKGTEIDVIAGAASPQEIVEKMVTILSDNKGATVDRRMEKRDGKEVEIIKVSVPRGEALEEWINIVDPKTHLPLGIKLQGYMEDGKFVEIMEGKFDYPETGPTDIYQAGAPRDAKIIEIRSSSDVTEAIEKYEMARENDISRYIAVVVYSRFQQGRAVEFVDMGTVIFTQGLLQRTEHLALDTDLQSEPAISVQLLADMGNTFDSMFKWWWRNEQVRQVGITLSDGEYDHQFIKNVSEDKLVRNSKDRYRKGRPPLVRLSSYTTVSSDLFQFGPRESVITINVVDNEYSRANNLICLEKAYHDKTDYCNQDGRRYKMLCYLDPQKDYLCSRFEEYFVKDALWQKNHSEGKKYTAEDIAKELKVTRVKEVVDFARTSGGIWYAKRIENTFTKQRPDGTVYESISTRTIYLDDNPQFPESVFNADTLPK